MTTSTRLLQAALADSKVITDNGPAFQGSAEVSGYSFYGLSLAGLSSGYIFTLSSLNTIHRLSITDLDITTISLDQSESLATGGANRDLVIKPDGTKIFVLKSNGQIQEITLSIAWDLTTGTTGSTYTAVSGQTSYEFYALSEQSNGAGTTFYVGTAYPGTSSNQTNNTYSLSSAWDASSTWASTTQIYEPTGGNTPLNVGGTSTSGQGLWFTSELVDGTSVQIGMNRQGYAVAYSFAANRGYWNILSDVPSSVTPAYIEGMDWNAANSTIVVVNGGFFYLWTLPTGWDKYTPLGTITSTTEVHPDSNYDGNFISPTYEYVTASDYNSSTALNVKTFSFNTRGVVGDGFTLIQTRTVTGLSNLPTDNYIRTFDGLTFWIPNCSNTIQTFAYPTLPYELSGTPTITSLSYTTLGIGSNYIQDLRFNNDGTKAFLLVRSTTTSWLSSDLYVYDLSTAYSTDDADWTLSASYDLYLGGRRITSLCFSRNGRQLYLYGLCSGTFFLLELTSPFDVESCPEYTGGDLVSSSSTKVRYTQSTLIGSVYTDYSKTQGALAIDVQTSKLTISNGSTLFSTYAVG